MDSPGPAFSARVPADLRPNQLTLALARLREAGANVVDLTETNPTRVGLEYPKTTLAPLADPASLVYDPQPFGLTSAREAVAADYRRRGLSVDPARVVLTASTSEAYSILFTLLCDPGDEVLTPRPSYPLFDHLTRLDGVVARPYHLEFHGAWSVDVDSMASAITPRTRAVVAVSPNNPTGSFLTADEIDAIGRLCAAHGLALVGDEVFADYVAEAGAAGAAPSVLTAPAALNSPAPLTFSLGGLSKSAGLPQLKLGWIAAGGPAHLVSAALDRLEVVCDTYLSVSTPVQQAAARLIDAGAAIRHQIRVRIAGNLARLQALTGVHPACTLLPVGGGWSAVVRVPATRSEEALVLSLLEEDHVLAHPGYFFDFPTEAYVVVSLLPEPLVFERGVSALLARATR